MFEASPRRQTIEGTESEVELQVKKRQEYNCHVTHTVTNGLSYVTNVNSMLYVTQV